MAKGGPTNEWVMFSISVLRSYRKPNRNRRSDHACTIVFDSGPSCRTDQHYGSSTRGRLAAAGVDVLVSLLTPGEVMELELKEEPECCRRQDVIYLSFPIPDRSIPPFSASTFTFLEQLKGQVSAGKHIAFHCRQGLGRAALMAASVLVLTGFSPGQAFELLSLARGYTVPETEEQRAWVVAFSRDQRSLPDC